MTGSAGRSCQGGRGAGGSCRHKRVRVREQTHGRVKAAISGTTVTAPCTASPKWGGVTLQITALHRVVFRLARTSSSWYDAATSAQGRSCRGAGGVTPRPSNSAVKRGYEEGAEEEGPSATPAVFRANAHSSDFSTQTMVNATRVKETLQLRGRSYREVGWRRRRRRTHRHVPVEEHHQLPALGQTHSAHRQTGTANSPVPAPLSEGRQKIDSRLLGGVEVTM